MADLIAVYDKRADYVLFNNVVRAADMATYCVSRLSSEWPNDVFSIFHNGNFVEIYNVTGDIQEES